TERMQTIDFFFSSRRRHTIFSRDWSSDVCSSDLGKFNPDYSQLSVARLGALEPESMNTNLELGISYLDMGMWDDAIEEFRQALRSEERRVGKGWRRRRLSRWKTG